MARLAEAMILIALLDFEKKSETPTNKHLSDKLGFKPQQTSIYLTKLKEYEYIDIKKNDVKHAGNYCDARSIRIKLTNLGRAQAWLSRASVSIMPGKDDLAIKITKMIKGAMGK